MTTLHLVGVDGWTRCPPLFPQLSGVDTLSTVDSPDICQVDTVDTPSTPITADQQGWTPCPPVHPPAATALPNAASTTETT